ncbi:MAG TPA: hypothetical protein VF389_11780 [Woeseiaceae bacterium]
MLNEGMLGGGPIERSTDAKFLRLLGEDGRSMENASSVLARPYHEIRDLCREYEISLSDYTPNTHVAKLKWARVGDEYELLKDGKKIGGTERYGHEKFAFRAFIETDNGKDFVVKATRPAAIRHLSKSIDRKSIGLFGCHDCEIGGIPE